MVVEQTGEDSMYDDSPENGIELIARVDRLSEEAKTMALNLAICLAKLKGHSEELKQMEPEFVRLINGTICVIRDITTILNAANHLDRLVYSVPSGKTDRDKIETKLSDILEQCLSLQAQLTKSVNCQGRAPERQ